MNRRHFLTIAGSSSIILAAGTSGCAMITSPDPALAPWEVNPSTYPDPIRKALSYAILAPNPHNRQPWLVELKGDTEAVLSCDPERLLPETDPFNRQIVIGLGCFLELFELAALNNGHAAQITLFPEGQHPDQLDTRPIASLKLVKSDSLIKDDLFSYALQRHTNRNNHDMSRVVDNALLTQIEKAAHHDVITGSSGSGERLEALRILTRDALRTEILTPKAFRESIDLTRIGDAEIMTNPDGISLRGFFMETMNSIGLLTRKKMTNPESLAFKNFLSMSAKTSMKSMSFVWINTPGNTRMDQISAGRSYMRMALEASRQRLAMQPTSYSLQEFATMEAYLRQTQDMLTNKPGQRVQMLARLGYAEAVGPAPRWPLLTRIRPS